MNIVLERDELAVVREAIDGTMKQLLQEIAHTDQREYRDDLVQKYDRLERVRRELDAARMARAS